MTGRPEIQQFECRWQPVNDLSPIAASMPMDSAKAWFDRLALWVGPPQPDYAVPTESVRYAIFHDGGAALAWRHWNNEAIPLGDETDRRPLVARVLVGDARHLTPQVAMAICWTGLPATIGPPPGMVKPEAPLPPIEASGLPDLASHTAAELDQVACNARGLDRLIAAVLNGGATPLSVQLPERDTVRSPQTGSQVPLLWGLWRTVFPLLQDSDVWSAGKEGWPAGTQGWSFSTFEFPLDDKDTRGLADIVFRTKQVTQPSMTHRREIIVRPHDPPSEPIDSTLGAALAEVLVDAFRHLGGAELMRHLDTIACKHQTLEQRSEAAYGSLHSRLAVVAEAGSQSGRPTVHAASPADVASLPTKVIPAMVTPETAAGSWPFPTSPGMDRAPETEPLLQPEPSAGMDPSTEADLQSWLNPAPAASLAVAGRDPQDAPPLRESEGRHASRPLGEASRPASLARLLDQLYAGPAEPGFDVARQFLHTAHQPPPQPDRAHARESMPERGWYIPSLMSDDPWHIEDTLEVIFRLTVIPDLSVPGVTEELARWTNECRAPVPVIKALSAAAWHQDSETYESMQLALEPAIFRRWLRENGIYAGPGAHAGAAPPERRAASSGNRAPDSNLLVRIFGGRLESEAIALILSVICALLTVLLVLAIVR
jgi:hypothetical protein